MNGTVIPDRNIENGQPHIRNECAAACFFCTCINMCFLGVVRFVFRRIDFCGYENEKFCVKIVVLQ